MRVGVSFTGDAEDPTARSGTPFGVLMGVRAHGIDATALKATLPTNIDRGVAGLDAIAHLAIQGRLPDKSAAKLAYGGAHLGRLTSLSRTAALGLRPSVREVDAVIALGSGYELPRRQPYVLYDDMTVRQAIDMEYPVWMSMRPSDRKFRLAQQRRIYNSAEACCMTTTWAAESAIEHYGVSPKKVVVVGAGTHEQVRLVDRDWSVPRFLFVGLDWKRKNGERVLSAFARLRETNPAASLDVVGGHPPIEQAGVTTHGRLFRNDPKDLQILNDLYDRATCFVMPSVHEPGGVVLVEAAAVGVGSIAGSRGGSRDFVGDAGLIVDPFDDEAIYSAMCDFANPVVAERYGRRAAERSALFTWSQVAGRLLRALRPSIELPDAILPLH